MNAVVEEEPPPGEQPPTAEGGWLTRGVASVGASKHGVFTDRPGTLSNDSFTNLLDMGTAWQPGPDGIYEGRDRSSGEPRWTATAVDLVFGSNSELRALAEVYASDDAGTKLAEDFAAAFGKVMNLDRFDID